MAAVAGCRKQGPQQQSNAIEFWHTRRGEQQKTLDEIVAQFNQQHPGPPITPIFQGNYDQIQNKVDAQARSKRLPALTVAYENYVAQWMRSGIVRPLDDLVRDPQNGLSQEALQDYHQQYLDINRYAQFDNQMLSFPFTKSNLILYANTDLLKSVGINKIPETWNDFEAACKAVTAKTGNPAYVFDKDASTFDGVIMSYGGELVGADGKTAFDSPATVKMLEMYQRLNAAKLARLEEGDTVENMFTGGQAAFTMASSSGRSRMDEMVKSFAWDVAMIPHAPGVKPVTVMFGPNICLFKSTPERERRGWEFIKYFTTPEVTAKWAMGSGYLPVRKSAAETAELKGFWEKNPRARKIFEMLPHARTEPNLAGWSEIRTLLEDTIEAIVNGRIQPAAAAKQLKEQADAKLVAAQ